MITNFKTFINENLLVPRNLEGREEKLKQINIKLLSQEVINGDLLLDESFMDIDSKFIKLKKVNGNVSLIRSTFLRGLWAEIPEWLKDVEITGNFCCRNNRLITLKNCPQKIGGNFECQFNYLTSLEGCAENIGGVFDCSENKLKSLKGCAKNIGRDFYCQFNILKTLEGGPKMVGGRVRCYNNKLISLEGCPENIGGELYCYDNKIKLELPKNVKLKGKFVN